MEFIIDHENYRGMPLARKPNGEITWICAGKSELGKMREAWWKSKAQSLRLPTSGKWIARVAKANHPTKMKICQTCGRELSIEYVYPTKNLIKRFNRIPGCEDIFRYEDFLSIDQVIHIIINEIGTRGFKALSEIFDIPSYIGRTEREYYEYIYENFIVTERGFLSPGAMSNAPDRLDGFHSYNICCRSKEDTGRHKENLSRYSEDRRAYEHWADGDWKAASWLMNQSGYGKCIICEKEGPVTADHIGPISLGFSHLPIFQPLCKSHNSAKNNRMFYKDVEKLIALERGNIKYYFENEKGNLELEKLVDNNVVSWHAGHIWDSLKNRVRTDDDALNLSKVMRISHHHVLELLCSISRAGYKDFLIPYLHPEYAHFENIWFKDLNESTFDHDGVVRREGTKKQYQNNAARYIRKAIQALDDYHQKENRRVTNIFKSDEIREISIRNKDIINKIRLDRKQIPELRRNLEWAFCIKQGDVIDQRISQILNKSGGLHSSGRNEDIHESILSLIRYIDNRIIEQRNTL